MTKRGNEQLIRGNAEYSKFADIKYSQNEPSSLPTFEEVKKNDAIKASKEYYIQAMKYYLQAHKCAPDNLTFLSNIEICMENASWIKWDVSVHKKIELKKTILAREEAKKKLPELRASLDKENFKLSKYESEEGFTNKLRIGNSERKVKNLLSEIGKLEGIASK